MDNERDAAESRVVLVGLPILMAVAGLILLVTALVGHGVVDSYAVPYRPSPSILPPFACTKRLQKLLEPFIQKRFASPQGEQVRKMPQTAKGYSARAEECVRLANLTTDEIIQRRLLELRQQYLATATRLAALGSADKRESEK